MNRDSLGGIEVGTRLPSVAGLEGDCKVIGSIRHSSGKFSIDIYINILHTVPMFRGANITICTNCGKAVHAAPGICEICGNILVKTVVSEVGSVTEPSSAQVIDYKGLEFWELRRQPAHLTTPIAA